MAKDDIDEIIDEEETTLLKTAIPVTDDMSNSEKEMLTKIANEVVGGVCGRVQEYVNEKMELGRIKDKREFFKKLAADDVITGYYHDVLGTSEDTAEGIRFTYGDLGTVCDKYLDPITLH